MSARPIALLCALLLSASHAAAEHDNIDALLKPVMLDVHPVATYGSFIEGAWMAQLFGGYQPDIGPTDAQAGYGTLGIGYFFEDNWSINGEFVFYDTSQPGEDPLGGGFNVILRWHFYQKGRFTLFIDGGGGLAYFDKKYPAGGTHFNYTAHAGAGFSYALDENLHLFAGGRYFHLSNAQIHGRDENPSIDAIGPYIGIMMTF